MKKISIILLCIFAVSTGCKPFRGDLSTLQNDGDGREKQLFKSISYIRGLRSATADGLIVSNKDPVFRIVYKICEDLANYQSSDEYQLKLDCLAALAEAMRSNHFHALYAADKDDEAATDEDEGSLVKYDDLLRHFSLGKDKKRQCKIDERKQVSICFDAATCDAAVRQLSYFVQSAGHIKRFKVANRLLERRVSELSQDIGCLFPSTQKVLLDFRAQSLKAWVDYYRLVKTRLGYHPVYDPYDNRLAGQTNKLRFELAKKLSTLANKANRLFLKPEDPTQYTEQIKTRLWTEHVFRMLLPFSEEGIKNPDLSVALADWVLDPRKDLPTAILSSPHVNTVMEQIDQQLMQMLETHEMNLTILWRIGPIINGKQIAGRVGKSNIRAWLQALKEVASESASWQLLYKADLKKLDENPKDENLRYTLRKRALEKPIHLISPRQAFKILMYRIIQEGVLPFRHELVDTQAFMLRRIPNKGEDSQDQRLWEGANSYVKAIDRITWALSLGAFPNVDGPDLGKLSIKDLNEMFGKLGQNPFPDELQDLPIKEKELVRWFPNTFHSLWAELEVYFNNLSGWLVAAEQAAKYQKDISQKLEEAPNTEDKIKLREDIKKGQTDLEFWIERMQANERANIVKGLKLACMSYVAGKRSIETFNTGVDRVPKKWCISKSWYGIKGPDHGLKGTLDLSKVCGYGDNPSPPLDQWYDKEYFSVIKQLEENEQHRIECQKDTITARNEGIMLAATLVLMPVFASGVSAGVSKLMQAVGRAASATRNLAFASRLGSVTLGATGEVLLPNGTRVAATKLLGEGVKRGLTTAKLGKWTGTLLRNGIQHGLTAAAFTLAMRGVQTAMGAPFRDHTKTWMEDWGHEIIASALFFGALHVTKVGSIMATPKALGRDASILRPVLSRYQRFVLHAIPDGMEYGLFVAHPYLHNAYMSMANAAYEVDESHHKPIWQELGESALMLMAFRKFGNWMAAVRGHPAESEQILEMSRLQARKRVRRYEVSQLRDLYRRSMSGEGLGVGKTNNPGGGAHVKVDNLEHLEFIDMYHYLGIDPYSNIKTIGEALRVHRERVAALQKREDVPAELKDALSQLHTKMENRINEIITSDGSTQVRKSQYDQMLYEFYEFLAGRGVAPIHRGAVPIGN